MSKRKQQTLKEKVKRVKLDTINLKATNKLETVFLDDGHTSWIKLIQLDDSNGLSLQDFEDLWCLKPIKKEQVIMFGKLIDCPRYSKSYLKSYKYSKLNHQAELILPVAIEKLLNNARILNPELNQVLVNWYEFDGSIGKHSDDEKQIKEHSDIFSYTFGPAKRFFVLEPKDKFKNNLKFQVALEHNTLVIMGGHCQQAFKHSVPKVNCLDVLNNRRLNITFRCFK